MITSRMLRLLLLSAAIFSSGAGAVGLGEISLHSHIGEALRADVPVLSGGESLDVACFSLGPVSDTELPVISVARMRLVRLGQDYRLIISGSKAINEPAVVISLRAGCGIDLQREYVLLPAPPPAPANEIDLPATHETRIPREVSRRQIRTEQQGVRAEAADDFPDESAAKRSKTRDAQSRVAKRNRPLPRDALAGIDGGKDRIILGAALDSLPQSAAGDPLAPIASLDERILKMETTLHLLNQEVDKLSRAATLAAEARAMREKLQGVDARQVGPALIPGAGVGMPERQPRDGFNHNSWLQLLLGVLLGGSVSAAVAHLVSRKQDDARPFDAPPRIARPGKTRHPAAA